MKKSIKALLLLSIVMLVTAGAASANIEPIYLDQNFETKYIKAETDYRVGPVIRYTLREVPMCPGDGTIIGFVWARGTYHLQEELEKWAYYNRINVIWRYNECGINDVFNTFRSVNH
ncbi:MAG: hypothetical protein GYA60_01545 [Candidatus Methanofastidiosa archaeon]|nr:hypothetical protein [Candidatus Methanofastidiosa archaeon]